MNILALLKNFCVELFYGSSYEARQIACRQTTKPIPSHLLASLNFHRQQHLYWEPSFPTKPFNQRTFTHSVPRSYPQSTVSHSLSSTSISQSFTARREPTFTASGPQINSPSFPSPVYSVATTQAISHSVSHPTLAPRFQLPAPLMPLSSPTTVVAPKIMPLPTFTRPSPLVSIPVQSTSISEPKEPTVRMKAFQAEETLSQSLQKQIGQLEKEKEDLLAAITVKPSGGALPKSIHPISSLTYNKSVQKQEELNKLNARLDDISNFCNQEMIDVLNLVMKGHETLNEKLTTLREETAKIEDEDLMCENVEHIAILEEAIDILNQLEAKFQTLQKAALSPNKTSQTEQEAHIDSLLEKIEKLYQQKEFLKACKHNLPNHQSAYDQEDLLQIMQSFENEEKELSQKTKESRNQLHQAEQFANDLTNHLLNYAETFSAHFAKLQRKVRFVDLPTPTPQEIIKTHIELPRPKPTHFKPKKVMVTLPPMQMNPIDLPRQEPIHFKAQKVMVIPPPMPLQAHLVEAEESEFNSADLRAAAKNVADAIKNLLQTVSVAATDPTEPKDSANEQQD
ncbi:hypothetical protein [Candidatus Protochlamydia phocaeensis]|uniref:hypothetical protein n=1 Tax=Candidatus Protochlamydia phocaeensis TaxID=1414722 RepID=UPI0008391F08|nr:hypothetical protein [Candidatus Protochlamydia phocaeensis]